MFPKLRELLDRLEVDTIALSRKRDLQPLIDYIKSKVASKKSIQLNFICTHNSRRSHLCQVWAQTIASYYDIKLVQCYSGGTEVTAIYPTILSTLEAQGFEIYKKKKKNKSNQKYFIEFSEIVPPVTGFSKVFDDSFNPSSSFAAIMTCDHASDNCPIVPGAEQRISITYIDPKVSDGTPEEKATYEERSIEIATEMKYVFSQINP